MIWVVFSIGIEAGGTKCVATSIPQVCFSPDVLHRRPVQAVHLASRVSLFLFSTISPNQTHVFFIFSHERARLFSGEIVENRNKDFLRASGQLEQGVGEELPGWNKVSGRVSQPFLYLLFQSCFKILLRSSSYYGLVFAKASKFTPLCKYPICHNM